MARRSFVPIGSRGEWPKFSNGKRFPYLVWGSTFSEVSRRVISDASRIQAISLVAIGQIERSEIALVSFGESISPDKRIAEFDTAAKGLLAGTLEVPGWTGEFEEPFEDFKTISRQENNGLVVVAHSSNGAESSSFGDIAPAVSAHALTTMGDLILNKAGIGSDPPTTHQASTAA